MSDKNFFGVLKTLNLSSFWTNAPKRATLKECRTFAQQHGIRLPTGVPQSKEAFVTLFMLCHLTPCGLVDLNKIKLPQKHLDALVAISNERDQKRHSKKKSRFVGRKKNTLSSAPKPCSTKRPVSRSQSSPKQQVVIRVRPGWPSGFTPEGQQVRAPQFGYRFYRA
ncbi:hypothetical protein HYW58_02590 [Candidatus Kaiserbacteria bacterium]|nr:hypothetical protein [Candidatus Kaiserbacteria bacterium]